jgi:cytochrome c biogenesis protein CcmG, thiol:disulfide interchange protein DsbE
MAIGKGRLDGYIVALGIIGALLLFWSKYSRVPSSPLLGKSAPDFSFRWPDGREGLLSSLRGKTVLLNFWASWCEPCMEEMPSLQALERKLDAAQIPFVLLAVNLDGVNDPPGISKMPKNLIFNYNHESIGAYSLGSIPVSVLIDPRGMVRQIYLGSRNWADPGIVSVMKAVQ